MYWYRLFIFKHTPNLKVLQDVQLSTFNFQVNVNDVD